MFKLGQSLKFKEFMRLKDNQGQEFKLLRSVDLICQLEDPTKIFVCDSYRNNNSYIVDTQSGFIEQKFRPERFMSNSIFRIENKIYR